MRDAEPTTDAMRPVTVAVSTDSVKEQIREAHELLRAVQFLNKNELETLAQGNKYSFATDAATRRPVIKLVDQATGRVLYQLPPDAILKAAAALRKKLLSRRESHQLVDGFIEE